MPNPEANEAQVGLLAALFKAGTTYPASLYTHALVNSEQEPSREDRDMRATPTN